MRAYDLIPGKIYKLSTGKCLVFSYIGSTGLAIFHQPGEPDMQSSCAIFTDEVERLATKDEIRDLLELPTLNDPAKE